MNALNATYDIKWGVPDGANLGAFYALFTLFYTTVCYCMLLYAVSYCFILLYVCVLMDSIDSFRPGVRRLRWGRPGQRHRLGGVSDHSQHILPRLSGGLVEFSIDCLIFPLVFQWFSTATRGEMPLPLRNGGFPLTNDAIFSVEKS